MDALILAGGLGTRLGSLAEARPKALMTVAGRPFAHHQLSWLRDQGVTGVIYSVGYLGDQIREFVQDGAAWGLRVRYVDEGEHLLGTGGALRLAADAGVLPPRFLVLYGDSYLQIDLTDLWRSHLDSGLPATMAVHRNEGRWDTSNVVFEDGRLIRYDKRRPPDWVDRMHHIDYGVSVLERDLVTTEIPAGAVVDLATVQHRLSVEGLLHGYEVDERFFEIGTPAGLAELDEHLDPGPPRP